MVPPRPPSELQLRVAAKPRRALEAGGGGPRLLQDLVFASAVGTPLIASLNGGGGLPEVSMSSLLHAKPRR